MTPSWFVNIDLWSESSRRSVEMEIYAATSREALIEAISRVELEEGELFHTVHIGSRPKPRRCRTLSLTGSTLWRGMMQPLRNSRAVDAAS